MQLLGSFKSLDCRFKTRVWEHHGRSETKLVPQLQTPLERFITFTGFGVQGALADPGSLFACNFGKAFCWTNHAPFLIDPLKFKDYPSSSPQGLRVKDSDVSSFFLSFQGSDVSQAREVRFHIDLLSWSGEGTRRVPASWKMIDRFSFRMLAWPGGFFINGFVRTPPTQQ